MKMANVIPVLQKGANQKNITIAMFWFYQICQKSERSFCKQVSPFFDDILLKYNWSLEKAIVLKIVYLL